LKNSFLEFAIKYKIFDSNSISYFEKGYIFSIIHIIICFSYYFLFIFLYRKRKGKISNEIESKKEKLETVKEEFKLLDESEMDNNIKVNNERDNIISGTMQDVDIND
jgi:hypothetical protein